MEAGGSELFVSRVLEVWADAGLDITLRTSLARGHAIDSRRDGYRVVRRSGRFSVFPLRWRESSCTACVRNRDARCRGMEWGAVSEPGVVPRPPGDHLASCPRKDVAHGAAGSAGQIRVASGRHPCPTAVQIDADRHQLDVIAAREIVRLEAAVCGAQRHHCSPGHRAHWCPDPGVARTVEPTIVAVGRLMPLSQTTLTRHESHRQPKCGGPTPPPR